MALFHCKDNVAVTVDDDLFLLVAFFELHFI